MSKKTLDNCVCGEPVRVSTYESVTGRANDTYCVECGACGASIGANIYYVREHAVIAWNAMQKALREAQ